jgi:PAS domain S-box-containing protein
MEVEDYEKLLKHVYRTAPIGLCLLDTELRYRHINEWLASINGLSVEAHLGRTISEVIPEVSAGVESLLRRVMETGEPVLDGVVEAGTAASPHQKRIFQHSYHAIMSDEGIVVGVSCIVQDITERKRAEDALVEARNQLETRVQARTAELTQCELRHRLLLESTNAVPWEAECTTWQFTYVGPQATKLLGYPTQQWLDIDFWSSHIHPEDRQWVIDYCLRCAKRGTNYDFEYRMIASDGRVVWLHDIVSVELSGGEPQVLRGFMVDITERKRAQERMRELSARMIYAQESERKRIARELHDDLSQRLALVAIELDLLRQNAGESHSVRDTAEHLSEQVKSLSTDVHRLAHSLHPSKLDRLGLVAAVEGVCHEICRPDNGLEIDCRAEGDFHSTPADVALCLYRVVQEALANVVKHSEAERVTVRLSCDQSSARLRVTDDGRGFETLSDSEYGGLGLISMRERVNMLGGHLTIRSDSSSGTEIMIDVPMSAGRDEATGPGTMDPSS